MNITTTRIEGRLMKPAQVAEILAIGLTSVYRLLETGELPAVRFAGWTVRVREDDLKHFIEAHTNARKPD